MLSYRVLAKNVVENQCYSVKLQASEPSELLDSMFACRWWYKQLPWKRPFGNTRLFQPVS